jgi:hypothetical protein
VNNGERFIELQVFRMREAKRDRVFTTIYCGSQVPQYSAFFGFDFAGGGLGYFDMKVFKLHDLVQASAGVRRVSPISLLGRPVKSFRDVGIGENLDPLTTIRILKQTAFQSVSSNQLPGGAAEAAAGSKFFLIGCDSQTNLI